MPRYELECQKCNEVFEHDCKIDDRNKIKCPKCHSKKVEQIFTKPVPKHLSWSSWSVGTGWSDRGNDNGQ
jgi:putative FmdB family regulatory protein